MTPKYEHDCPDCEFLRTYRGSDLYWCEGTDALVLRFGPNRQDYRSKTPSEVSLKISINQMQPDNSYAVALRRLDCLSWIREQESKGEQHEPNTDELIREGHG